MKSQILLDIEYESQYNDMTESLDIHYDSRVHIIDRNANRMLAPFSVINQKVIDGRLLELSEKEAGDLIIMLNIELRNRGLAKDYKMRLNNVFKQLTGHDHDCL